MAEAVIPATAPTQPPRSRAATRQAWVERLARFPDSGLSPAQFCAQEGVSLPSFYAWKRRLATAALACHRGVAGLVARVRNRLQADPWSGHLFIFRNRTADRLKVLYGGGHGLCLWCQRLEAGRYHFPEAPAGSTGVELSAGQFQMILDGIDLSRV